MPSSEYPEMLGWEYKPKEIEAVCLALEEQGEVVSFAGGNANLKDYGVGKNAYLWDAERNIFGKDLGAMSQKAGVCVSCGTARAATDSYWTALDRGLLIGEPKKIAAAPIYGGSRIQIGGGRLGNGQGSVGGWAAQWVHDYGLLPEGKVGQYDLTGLAENLALQWGKPGVGVPQDLIAESITGVKCHKCDTPEELRDCVAAGFGATLCCSLLWQLPYQSPLNKRDENGFCAIIDRGNHCQSVRGVFHTKSGELAFLIQQSWGNSMPSGPSIIFDCDGLEVELPPGVFAITNDDMKKAIKAGGEIWSIEVDTSWRPSKLLAGDHAVDDEA